MAAQLSAAPSAKATNALTTKLDLALRRRLLKEHDPKIAVAEKRLDEAWKELLRLEGEIELAGGSRYADGVLRRNRDLAKVACDSAGSQLRFAVDARTKALSEAMPESLRRRISAFGEWCRQRAQQERLEGSVKAGPLGDKAMAVQCLRVRGDKKKLEDVLQQFEEMHQEFKGYEKRAFAYDDLQKKAVELWVAEDPAAGLDLLAKQFEPVEREADHAV